MTELDQEEIYDRMQRYWVEADDLHKMASASHLAFPEANAIVNHAMVALDNLLMEAALEASLGKNREARGFVELANKVAHSKSGLFMYVFLTGYNLGRAGSELIKVPAACEHNHGIDN